MDPSDPSENEPGKNCRRQMESSPSAHMTALRQKTGAPSALMSQQAPGDAWPAAPPPTRPAACPSCCCARDLREVGTLGFRRWKVLPHDKAATEKFQAERRGRGLAGGTQRSPPRMPANF